MNFPESSPFDPDLSHQRHHDQRHLLVWGAVGLAPKQALVLKSMMRLIDHKLDHKWFFSATAMDLCLHGDDYPAVGAPVCRDATGQPAHVLTLGQAGPKDQTDFLSLPLYVDALVQTFNRIGQAIQLKKSAASEAPFSRTSLLPNALLRLKRWPPAHLLGTPDRIRMATLLTGHSLVLQELQRRAGQPLAACEAFIKDLARLGLLQPVQASPHAVPASNRSAAVKPQTAPSAPSASWSGKPGLLDKIRTRLGFRTSA